MSSGRGWEGREGEGEGRLDQTSKGDPARLQEIRRWAPGLQVMPVPASDIAGRLGLQHYPVLITATTLQQ